MMMAQNATEVGTWLLVSGLVLNFLVSLVTLWRMTSNDPQKRDVTIQERLASKEELRLHIEANREEHTCLLAEMRRGDQRIHERVDGLMRQFNERLQALPNEVVALLRNTGAIR